MQCGHFLILLGQHDGDDALGDRRIGGIGRVIRERLVEIIDFEKDGVAVSFERAEVVLAKGVVGVAEIVIDRDGLDDPVDRRRITARSSRLLSALS